MPDTFDRLCARLDLPRPEREPDRSTIVIEAIQPSRMFTPYGCLVGVDGRKVAHLYDLRASASAEISSGDHEITVRLGPDVSAPLSIRIEPGERIDLVCGKKPEWSKFESGIMRRLTVIYAVSFTFAILGWLTYPLEKPSVLAAFAVWVPSFFGFWLQNRWTTALLINGMINFPLLIYAISRQHRELRQFRAEIGPRCYVALRSPEDFKKKLTQDDWGLE